jgi:hypothetical protein
VTVASLADMGYVVSMTSADAAGGRLTISAAPTGATAGFTLNGVLNDGTLAVGWLVASDRATPPGG